MHPDSPVLIIDDEKRILEGLQATLLSVGIDNVLTVYDSREVMPLLSKRDIAVVILDLTMPHVSGEELLTMIKKDGYETPVIVLTGLNDVDTAVRCIKAGAVDYIVKPVENDRLVSAVKMSIEMCNLKRENRILKERLLKDNLENPDLFSHIVTNSKKMRSIFQYIESIAKSPRPVLITGETGVGKELIARAVHNASGRKGRFVAVNISGLDETLFMDTLFGHKKGAYSSANEDRAGLIEEAKAGTIFLDEIGDLDKISQVKLLRLLQDGEYYKLGSDISKLSSASVVVATNYNIKERQEKGLFRKDLYYRLSSHHISVPPLRERPEDLLVLFNHFLEEASSSLGKKKPSVTFEINNQLGAYHFPGNVRELENIIYDAVSRHKKGVLSLKSFLPDVSPGVTNAQANVKTDDIGAENDIGVTLSKDKSFPTIKKTGHFLIQEALKHSNGNQKVAAKLLGITPSALNKRIHNMDD